VTLKDGTRKIDAIKRFLADRLSPMAMPLEIESRKELPKALIEKLSKNELIEEEVARIAQAEHTPEANSFPNRSEPA
jgi:long-chain acyl-CoA synthetase